ncbi:hypothetical protein [Leptolyngbya sp. Cla-17]|uniref:hypothetical protein n=1 Tax=Leptolyngbya sp. Cla-17 TaxID=2803751 RepID=UPI00247842C5|nr:hypothetical protein [Leptolyngbya sp. Cla-17]
MLTTIMVYKFTNLSRQEIETMLGISLQQTRVYQEAKEEALQQVVINLLKEGMTVEAIARVTGLSVEQSSSCRRAFLTIH